MKEVKEMVEILELFRREGELKARINRLWKEIERERVVLGEVGRDEKEAIEGGLWGTIYKDYELKTWRFSLRGELTEEKVQELIEKYPEKKQEIEEHWQKIKELRTLEEELKKVKEEQDKLVLSPQELKEVLQAMEEEKERLWEQFWEEVKDLKAWRRTEIANLREDSMIAFALKEGKAKVKRAVERWLEAQNFKNYKWLRFFLWLTIEDGVELNRESIVNHLEMVEEYEALEDLLDSETPELWAEVERLCQILGACGVNR